MTEEGRDYRIGRRNFLKSTAGATFSIVGADALSGTAAASRIKLGIIGCGGRGTWIADLFRKHGAYELYAGADYFTDRVETFGQKYGLDSSRLFTGLSCHRKMIDSGVEAVAIISPPYFHPSQTMDAVEAGVHTYVAKPIAVDTPGCNTIREAAQKASGKLCLLVDFQTRADKFFCEAVRRIHDGALGDLAFGEATYHANNPFSRMHKYLEKDKTGVEDRLRAWGLSRALSGDIITEQNIHTLDVASWIMNTVPVSAKGTHGRLIRNLGDCSDYFAAFYQYPDNVGITFSSRQFAGHGSKPDGIRNRMFGSKGVLESKYGGEVIIRGGKETFYRGGDTSRIYREGAEANIAAFHDNIMKENFDNPTVEPSIRSTLVTFLGREAAYSGREVTWSEIVRSRKSLQFDLEGLKE